MTEQSSCKKSFFREYFFYRLSEMKGFFFTSCILNLLSLPFVGAAMLSFAERGYYIFVEKQSLESGRDLVNYALISAVLCWGALLITACIAPSFSFIFYNKKEFSDTLGVLPLSHRERFWGDFLGGYAAAAAPIIPSTLISVILFSLAQSAFNKTASAVGAKLCENAVPYMLGLSLSLFFAYAFAYIIASVITVCCGRFGHSMIFSFLALVIMPIFAITVTNCVIEHATGFYGGDALTRISVFLPPLGLMMGEITNILKGSVFGVPSSPEEYSGLFNGHFTLTEPYALIIYVLGAAAFIAAAYYLSRSRRQERVGRSFVHTAAFHAVSLGAAAMLILMFLTNMGSFDLFASVMLGLGAAAVTLTVFEVIRRPPAKEIPKTLLRFGAAFAACIGLYFLLSATGSFGLRYSHPALEDIDHINVGIQKYRYDGTKPIDERYKISDRNDMEDLINMNNDTLKRVYRHVTSGGEYLITYVLKDGTEQIRGFSDVDAYHGYSGVNDLINNIYSLDGYLAMSSAVLTDGTELKACTVKIKDTFAQYTLAEDKITEFAAILAKDIVENGGSDAAKYGAAEFVISELEDKTESVYFMILETYTRSIDFLMNNGNSGTADENALVIELTYNHYHDDSEIQDLELVFSVVVYQRDLDNTLVKELLTLVKESDIMPDDKDDSLIIYTSNSFSYYIPKSAHDRVLEIMVELARSL